MTVWFAPSLSKGRSWFDGLTTNGEGQPTRRIEATRRVLDLSGVLS